MASKIRLTRAWTTAILFVVAVFHGPSAAPRLGSQKTEGLSIEGDEICVRRS
jgi:hypothetical protein